MIAFAAVVERAGVAHLADLFVLPERFGQGIRGQLLAEILGDAAMRTTFASSDPRALPLYVRNGMIPLSPNLYLEVDSASLPPSSPGFRCEPAAPEQRRNSKSVSLGATTATFIASGHRFPMPARLSSSPRDSRRHRPRPGSTDRPRSLDQPARPRADVDPLPVG